MQIDYGPPGARGVTTLMSVGELDGIVDSGELTQTAHTVGVVSVGVWLFGFVAGDRKLRKTAFRAGAVAFLVELFGAPR